MLLLLTLIKFQEKSELGCAWCGMLKNFKGKLKWDFKKFIIC